MRRREALAGIGSVGVLGTAGFIAVRGLPALDDGDGDDASSDDDSGDATTTAEPTTIETLDAPGSERGEIQIPAADRATFIDFFGTWCPPCVEQMPELAKANERIGDSVQFVSVTTEAVGRAISREEVVDWWEKHDGNWLLGIDPTTELAVQYNPTGYPYAVALDAAGTVHWSGSGIKSADEIVAGIESARGGTDE